MHAILHNVYIRATSNRVFEAMTTPAEINQWWTLESGGKPVLHSKYRFYFSPANDWKAEVTQVTDLTSIEWKMTIADSDWTGTSFGFTLVTQPDMVRVEFYHKDWKTTNEHYRMTSYCWAMYLNLLKRYLEKEEIVPYNERIFI